MTSQEVKKLRIAVMGPSKVGKSQFINRIINQSFETSYEPTLTETIYRKSYKLKTTPSSKPDFFDIELWDMFPFDNELIDQDPSTISQQGKRMEKVLDQVLQSPFSNLPLVNRIHGFIMMFDRSDKKSFQSLVCLVETLHELEKQFRQ